MTIEEQLTAVGALPERVRGATVALRTSITTRCARLSVHKLAGGSRTAQATLRDLLVSEARAQQRLRVLGSLLFEVCVHVWLSSPSGSAGAVDVDKLMYWCYSYFCSGSYSLSSQDVGSEAGMTQFPIAASAVVVLALHVLTSVTFHHSCR